MDSIKINIPKGMEIDRDKSDFSIGEIHLKEVEVDAKFKYPKDISLIPGRNYYLNFNDNNAIMANVEDVACIGYKYNVSTEKRAKALLALIQLVELRDAWNKIDNFVVDWKNSEQTKYTIETYENELSSDFEYSVNKTLYFGSSETSDLFFEIFKDLIKEAKEFL